MSETTPARGRPISTTDEEIEEAALRLWSQHSFQDVSIADIAEEVGVSSRTIFRRYPTKADIVWAPMTLAFHALGTALEQSSPSATVMERAASAVVRVIREGDIDPTSRHRIKIIGRTPELQSSTSSPFRVWRQSLLDFATNQPGVDPLWAHVMAHCVQATALAGLIWWVTEKPDSAPWQAVNDAFRRLLNAQETRLSE